MRQLILEALHQRSHISGEELGARFKVSRTAVWKHIRQLRKRGYQIDSSPRLGYALVKNTELLLPEEISLGLETSVIGKHIRHFEEVTSTQDLAEELARSGAEEGTVVISERQTEGRGRKGRAWDSPTQGVYLSVVLKPALRPSQIVQIPLIAGVAATRAIKRVTPLIPRLKWPNDITISGRKVGGILAEMNCEMDTIHYIILGIGINVNAHRLSLSEPVRGLATSLAEECGEHVSRVRTVQCLLTEFEALYGEFLFSGFDTIRQEWKALNNTTGSRVRVSGGGEEVEGRALDIDQEGFLLVKMDTGDVKRIISGDLTVVGGV